MKFAEMKDLETERLVLRRMCFDDLYNYYERICSDGNVTRYMKFEPHQDIGETLARLEKTLAEYEAGGRYCWVITVKGEDELIGIFDLLELDESDSSCTFAYMLGESWWGKGYATEAMKAVFAFAFEELEVELIRGSHFSGNTASGAVMRKAGMTHIGTVPGKYEKQGQLHDGEIYELRRAAPAALTANEYQKKAMGTLNPAMSKRDVLINGVMGLCGEGGECIDLVQKHLHQGHELDTRAMARELGDVAWYLAETAYALDLSLEDILRGNLEKLKTRYPKGFDSARSINR